MQGQKCRNPLQISSVFKHQISFSAEKDENFDFLQASA